MAGVLVDANVFVSLLTGRHERQDQLGRALLQEAEDGNVVAFVPQFVVFEITYVLQTVYNVTGERLASMLREVVTFPGVRIVDDWPWRRVLELWPSPFPSLADASLVALAITHRYDAIATFDHKLVRRAKELGVASYW